MADVNVSFEGWNSISQSWGSSGWGEDAAFTGLTGAVGSVTVVEGSGVTVTVTGLAGTSSVGSVTIGEGTGVTVTGNSVTVSSGGVNVWSVVVTSQTPNWSEISTSQTPNWSDIAA
jgi:hypothetical protein